MVLDYGSATLPKFSSLPSKLVDKGSQQRSVSLNTNYFVIFNNPLDNDQIRAMSSQMYAKNSKFLVEA